VVVDDARASDVHFVNNTINFLLRHLCMAFLDSLSKLFNLDRTRTVRVNLIELFAKFEEFTRINHLDKDVEALSSQPVSSMEARQAM